MQGSIHSLLSMTITITDTITKTLTTEEGFVLTQNTQYHSLQVVYKCLFSIAESSSDPLKCSSDLWS